MVRYQIPSVFLPGFRALAQMKDAEVKQLVSLLKEMPVGSGITEFRKSIQAKNLSKSALLTANTIYSFPELLTGKGEEKVQLAEDLSDAFEQQSEEKVSLDFKKQLNQNLLEVLTNSENLQKTFKAVRLLHENAKTYQKSRIVTDVRFIFDDDFEHPLKCGLIIHQVKLQYLQNNEEKEFFISMDSNDLRQLKDNLDRGLEKEKVIKKGNQEVDFLNFI